MYWRNSISVSSSSTSINSIIDSSSISFSTNGISSSSFFIKEVVVEIVALLVAIVEINSISVWSSSSGISSNISVRG